MKLIPTVCELHLIALYYFRTKNHKGSYRLFIFDLFLDLFLYKILFIFILINVNHENGLQLCVNLCNKKFAGVFI